MTLEELAAELAAAQLAGHYGRQVTIWHDEKGWEWGYGVATDVLCTNLTLVVILTWDPGDEEDWVGSEEEALAATIAQDLDVTFEDRLERQERQTS